MNKQEYVNRLNELLACLPADHRLESVSFYEEMIDDRMEDGMTEEQAVAALDAPGVAAEKILDDLPAVPRAVVKTRRKSRALLWSAAIIGSPLWVALALAFAASKQLALLSRKWLQRALSLFTDTYKRSKDGSSSSGSGGPGKKPMFAAATKNA